MQHFQISDQKDVLKIIFHAPDSSNAMSLKVARELADITKAHWRSRKPVLLSSGHERLFCSGGNLSDYRKLKTKAAGLKVNREIAKSLDQFGAWPAVKLALVDGDVLGGGMEWLACFDFRWCTPNVLFGFWQKRMGLTTGWSGGKRWVERLGERPMRDLLMQSELLGAARALELGIVDQVVSPWLADTLATEWLARVAGGGITPELLRWKSARESKIFSDLWLGPAHKAALARWK